jgi:excisionase family DNA binding protein
MKKTPALDSHLLDAAALGRILGLTRPTVYRLARDGELPSIKISRKVRRFERDAVAKWLLRKAAS